MIYAIDEERLNRKKHSAGQLPYLGIIETLKFANIAIEDIDYLATHGSTWGEQYEDVLKEYMRYQFGHCPKIVRVHHHMAHAASAYYGSGYDEAMILTMDASGDGVAIQKKVKIFGVCEISQPMTVTGILVTKGAKESIEKAGGTVTVVEAKPVKEKFVKTSKKADTKSPKNAEESPE